MTNLALRAAATSRSTEPFSWDPPAALPATHSPFSPPFHPLPADLMDIYGPRPMDDWTGGTEGAKGKGVAGKCKNSGCGKVLLESGVEEHAKLCAINMQRIQLEASMVAGGKKSATTKKYGGKNNKRSALEGSPTPSISESTGGPAPKRIKITHKGSLLSVVGKGDRALSQEIVIDDQNGNGTVSKGNDQLMWLEDQDRLETMKERNVRMMGERKDVKLENGKRGTKFSGKDPIDLDRQCGVITNEKVCPRSITCKIHNEKAKSVVEGRSQSFKVLEASQKARDLADSTGAGPGERKKGKNGVGMEKAGKLERTLTDTVAGGVVPVEGGDSMGTPSKQRKRKPKQVGDAAPDNAEAGPSNGPPPERASRMDYPDREFFEMVYGAKMVHAKVVENSRARIYGLPPSENVVGEGNMSGQGAGDADADGDVDMDPADNRGTSTQSEINNVFGFLAPPKPRAVNQNLEANNSVPPPAATKEPKLNKKAWQPKKTPDYLPDVVQFKSYGGGATMGSWHLQRREESAMEGVVFNVIERATRQKRMAEMQLAAREG